MRRRPVRVPASRSGFAGFRFPREIIVLAVRWYLRYGLSYRDVEELLAERGIKIDHVTVYRLGAAFHAIVDRWGTTVPAHCGRSLVRGRNLPQGRRPVDYLYRAIDQFGQVIDVLAAEKRDMAATRRFGLPARPRGADSGRLAPHRALRQQPDRIRPRPVKVPTPADARPQATPLRTSDQRRACLRAEPPPRPLGLPVVSSEKTTIHRICAGQGHCWVSSRCCDVRGMVPLSCTSIPFETV
jgi:hypothetical protein